MLELEFNEMSGKKIWVNFEDKQSMKYLYDCGWTPNRWRA